MCKGKGAGPEGHLACMGLQEDTCLSQRKGLPAIPFSLWGTTFCSPLCGQWKEHRLWFLGMLSTREKALTTSARVQESTRIRERQRIISCVFTNKLAAITSAVCQCALSFIDDSLIPPVAYILQMFKVSNREALWFCSWVQLSSTSCSNGSMRDLYLSTLCPGIIGTENWEGSGERHWFSYLPKTAFLESKKVRGYIKSMPFLKTQ